MRKAAGIESPRWDPTEEPWLIAEAQTPRSRSGGNSQEAGSASMGRQGGECGSAVVLTEQQAATSDSEPTLRDVSETLVAVYGTDFGIHSPTWISRFTDMTRQAAVTETDVSCWPATPRTCIPRWVDRASTSVCRMR